MHNSLSYIEAFPKKNEKSVHQIMSRFKFRKHVGLQIDLLGAITTKRRDQALHYIQFLAKPKIWMPLRSFILLAPLRRARALRPRGSSDWQLAFGNWHLAKGKRQWAKGNGQKAIGYRQWAMGKRQLAIGNRQ